jgi:hypothetical protein
VNTTGPTIPPQIALASWFVPEADHGVWKPRTDDSWCRPSPPLETGGQIAQMVGRPVRYLQRMAAETRHALCAASLALAVWPSSSVPAPSIGLLNGCFDGTLASDMAYYQDYLATGRTLARGNLFVYTLPTSVSGAVSAVLGLTGPAFYLHDDQAPLHQLLVEAHRMVHTRQADAMLVLWSDPLAAVCLAVGPAVSGTDHDALNFSASLASKLQTMLGDSGEEEPSPLELARRLSREVEST